MPGWVKISLIVLALLLPLEVATGVWYWVTGQVIEQTNLWVAARRAEGITVSLGPASREGWPLQARIRMSPSSITSASRPGRATATLEAESITVGVPLWKPNELHVGLYGTQRALWGGGRVLLFTSARTELILPLSSTQPPAEFDAVLDDLKFATPLVSMGMAKIQIHAGFAADHVAGSVSADGIELAPTALAAAIGETVEHASVELSVDGPLMASPAVWKAAGGKLHLTQATLTWGKLGVVARGEGELDDQLQPSGSLTARVTGAADILDALVAARMVTANVANGTRTLFALMQKPAPDGTATVELPFTLKNQRLQMGQFPVMRVPEATW